MISLKQGIAAMVGKFMPLKVPSPVIDYFPCTCLASVHSAKEGLATACIGIVCYLCLNAGYLADSHLRQVLARRLEAHFLTVAALVFVRRSCLQGSPPFPISRWQLAAVPSAGR